MHAMVTSAALLMLLLGGCSVSFKFGKPPRGPTGPFKVDDCVWKHAIQMRPAWSSTLRERNPDARVERARKSRAWTFYRGGRRLNATDVVKRLEDPQLAKAYGALWKPVARRGRNRVLGSSTGLAAVALLGITGGAMLYGWPPSGDASLSKAERGRVIAGFVFIGAAVVTSVILPLIMRVGYRDVRAGETFRTLFVSAAQEPALRRALAKYNLRVRRACGERF